MLTEVEKGEITSIRGNPDHPLTRGYLCSKMRDPGRQRMDTARLLKPLLRSGPKGSGRFESVSWDRALAVVADRVGEVLSRNPHDLLQFNSGGNMGVLNSHFPERFFNYVGSSGVIETICNSAGMRALEYVYGTCHGQDPEIIPDLDLLVTWGANPAWTNPHGFALVRQMQKKGGRHVVIDPVRTATALRADHLAINPGTDWHLAMGVINLLIHDGLVDHEYVSTRTVGYDNLRDLAVPYTPERVSRVTGLAAEQITALGRMLAESRNFLIHIGWGLQRRLWAGHGVRAISFIPALLGKGRQGLIYSNNKYGFDTAYLEATHLDRGRPRVNMMRIPKLLADGHFRALISYNSNPMASLANLNALKEGLGREDIFTVVHDLYLTDTALFADVVLPATHFLESEDLRPSYYHRYLGFNARAVVPLGESVSNRDLFRMLSRALGTSRPELVEDDDSLLAKTLAGNPRIMNSDDLRRRGWTILEEMDLDRISTPSGKVEFCSQVAAREGAGEMPSSHQQSRGDDELNLLSPAHRDSLRSQDYRTLSQREPELRLNPIDAVRRNIADGMPVQARNSSGTAQFVARLTEDVPRGVALTYSSPWPQMVVNGTVNHLASDLTGDHGGGSIYNSTLIRLAPLTPCA
ncbi:molybdopterin-dependent oxidoreductase [Dehalococcoidia bacterium]|nr:molybdopterin-dependent oxidoreductase [Dehalococcoidia bacterium]